MLWQALETLSEITKIAAQVNKTVGNSEQLEQREKSSKAKNNNPGYGSVSLTGDKYDSCLKVN